MTERYTNHSRVAPLAGAAIAGQLVLLASAWLLPLVSEYTLLGDSISELALGRYGFIQTIAFVLGGLGTLALAYVIYSLTAGVRWSLVGSLLIALYGVGAILEAIFPTDRVDSAADLAALSTTGMIHGLVALISFVGVIIGMFALTWTFARATNWRAIVIGSSLLAGAALALMTGEVLSAGGPLPGLNQRLLVTVIAAWQIMVALRARSLVTSGDTGLIATQPESRMRI